MNQIDLKRRVADAIDLEWDRYTRDHPNLARVIDRRLLVEQATRTIADDPHYQTAMQHSAAVGISARVIQSVVEHLVSKLLDRLV